MGRRSLKARSEHSLRVDILECHARYKGLLCLRTLGSGQKAAMTPYAASGNRHELLLSNFPKSLNEKKKRDRARTCDTQCQCHSFTEISTA